MRVGVDCSGAPDDVRVGGELGARADESTQFDPHADLGNRLERLVGYELAELRSDESVMSRDDTR